MKNAYVNTNFIYDVFGNLKQAGKVSYQIDPLQKRSARLVNGVVTNRYIYNPEGQLIGELDGSGNLAKTFIYASKSHVPDYFVDSINIRYKLVVDQLGSIRLVVNASTGEVVQKMNHDEFGKILIDTKPMYQPFGFAGGLYDSETKLVRFGVRDYDSQTGRWLSKDPIRFGGGDANLYGYTFNDPVNFVDPTGKSFFMVGSGGTSGYIDLNVTVGIGFVGTFGAQIGSGAVCFYAGAGTGTGPVGGSINYTGSGAPSSGASSCVSGGAGIGGSVSANDSGISFGVGLTTPGIAQTVTGTLICF